MANESEILLGRLIVERSLATQEQVLQTLRDRNADPEGPSLGERLVKKGVLTQEQLDDISAAGRATELRQGRDEAATDHMIPLGSAREAIARECLREAEAALATDRDSALKELGRLAAEFADTESGNRAQALLGEHRP